MTIHDQFVTMISQIADGTDEEFDSAMHNFVLPENLERLSRTLRHFREKSRYELVEARSNGIRRLETLFMIWDEAWDRIHEHWEESPKTDYQYRINSTGKLFNRSLQLCFEMISAIENGALLSSVLVWRAIYENYVVARYLIQADENTSDRFNDYLNKEKALLSNLLIDNKDARAGTSDTPTAKQYGWFDPTGAKGTTFDAIRVTVGEVKFYPYYTLACNLTHATSFSVNHSVFGGRGHRNTEYVGPLDQDGIQTLECTVEVMIEFSDLLMSVFCDPDTSKSFRILQSMVAKVEHSEQDHSLRS